MILVVGSSGDLFVRRLDDCWASASERSEVEVMPLMNITHD